MLGKSTVPEAKSKAKSKSAVIIILSVVLIAAILFSLMLGRYPVTPGELIDIIFSDLFGAEQYRTDASVRVLYNIRLPRIFLACLVGCCLSAAGAAYQGVFQNPMASPDILGASNGAAFGAALAILFGASRSGVTVAAFTAGLITVVLVFIIGERAHGKRVVTLILAGIMVSSLFSAGTSLIKLVADPSDRLPAITYWLMGSLAGTEKEEVAFICIPMLVGLIPLILFRWRINLLTLGDDEARALGVNAKYLRGAVIVCATLITAASVSVSGMIGWVGLVIPHLMRRLVGNDFKYLLPASMFSGAVFLLLVDDISRNLLATEIPIGILTAFVGAPFFIRLILRREQV